MDAIEFRKLMRAFDHTSVTLIQRSNGNSKNLFCRHSDQVVSTPAVECRLHQNVPSRNTPGQSPSLIYFLWRTNWVEWLLPAIQLDVKMCQRRATRSNFKPVQCLCDRPSIGSNICVRLYKREGQCVLARPGYDPSSYRVINVDNQPLARTKAALQYTH